MEDTARHWGNGPETNEEPHEPTDPHPDTPDDFDEGVDCGRESEEAAPEETAPED